jgi:hypothetical protein
MPPDPVLAEPVDVGSFVVDLVLGQVVPIASAVDVSAVVVGPVVVVVDAPAAVVDA